MLKAEHATRSEEWREVEPIAEGDPDITADPPGTLVGGVPVGLTEDAVVARAELARWLDRADFPSDGPNLVEAALDHLAPAPGVAGSPRPPDGDTHRRV